MGAGLTTLKTKKSCAVARGRSERRFGRKVVPLFSVISQVKHKILYTSAYVFEIDTVREAFKKANIPFYVQTENLAGVRSAFPASPASGLGTRWHVFVPAEAEVKAKKILSTLHLSIESDLKTLYSMRLIIVN